MIWGVVAVGVFVAAVLGKRRRTLLWLYARQRLRGKKRARRVHRDHVEYGAMEEEEEAP
jgi:hypothetical protein